MSENKKPIALPVVVHTEESGRKKQLGLDFSIKETIKQVRYFYTIDCVSPYEEDGLDLSFAICSGCEFIIAMEIDELLDKINKWLNH